MPRRRTDHGSDSFRRQPGETVTEYDKHAGATFPTGTIRVIWRSGSWADRTPEQVAVQIAKAAEALEAKGYTVERRTSTTGEDFLHVTKED